MGAAQAFTDAFSKTIPMWAAVINRAVAAIRESSSGPGSAAGITLGSPPSDGAAAVAPENYVGQSGSDCDLHLPLWVSANEAQQIEARLDGWVQELLACVGAEQIQGLAEVGEGGLSIEEVGTPSTLRFGSSEPHILFAHYAPQILTKPLRPLWISQSSRIWVDQVRGGQQCAVEGWGPHSRRGRGQRQCVVGKAGSPLQSIQMAHVMPFMFLSLSWAILTFLIPAVRSPPIAPRWPSPRICPSPRSSWCPLLSLAPMSASSLPSLATPSRCRCGTKLVGRWSESSSEDDNSCVPRHRFLHLLDSRERAAVAMG